MNWVQHINSYILIYLEMWIYEEQRQHLKAGVISRCTILSHGMLSFGEERISTSCKILWYSCKDIFRDAAGNLTYAPGRVHIWQIGNLIRIGHKRTLILWEIWHECRLKKLINCVYLQTLGVTDFSETTYKHIFAFHKAEITCVAEVIPRYNFLLHMRLKQLLLTTWQRHVARILASMELTCLRLYFRISNRSLKFCKVLLSENVKCKLISEMYLHFLSFSNTEWRR